MSVCVCRFSVHCVCSFNRPYKLLHQVVKGGIDRLGSVHCTALLLVGLEDRDIVEQKDFNIGLITTLLFI